MTNASASKVQNFNVLFGLLGVTLASALLYGQPTSQSNISSLGLAGYAKVLASAVFVSHRDPEEARVNSGIMFVPEGDREHITDIKIDRVRKLVRMTLRGKLTRTARYYGDQGCVIVPEGREDVFFEPVPVRSKLGDADSMPWPMGDVLPSGPLPDGIDALRIKRAVDLAFADPEALTAAMVVVHKGRIIGERYDLGVTKDTQLESWSMGKSLTATLIGQMIEDGHIGLNDPAPVAEWRKGPGDPRAKIRIADLLRMSSGLKFTSRDSLSPGATEYPDHVYIYAGAVDAFKFSYTKPLEFPPNTVGRYRNCDPLILGHIIKETVKKQGREYLTYPQGELFDKIGIRKMVLEPDPYGNFLLTGFDYGTARNWARLGMLWLQEGNWQGEKLLSKEFVKFCRSPAPAWERGNYGGLFWLNTGGGGPLPKDAYNMAGASNQKVYIVPSLDLVVVRMGHFRGGPRSNGPLNNALRGIVGALNE